MVGDYTEVLIANIDSISSHVEMSTCLTVIDTYLELLIAQSQIEQLDKVLACLCSKKFLLLNFSSVKKCLESEFSNAAMFFCF